MRVIAFLVASLLASTAAAADKKLAEGWTPEAVKEANVACTDALVDGAWKNTKREQKLDETLALTPEIREQLAPQIKAFGKLCECTVRKMAEKFSRNDYEHDDGQVEKYARELVENGTCKLPKP
ncbi:MAG: hypothetical protein KIT14_11360 [bacterium]|nr:hypothetical protein [bacterium]